MKGEKITEGTNPVNKECNLGKADNAHKDNKDSKSLESSTTTPAQIILPSRKVEVIKPRMLDEDKFERSKRLGWFNLEMIEKARVLVVGCGALGNEVTKNLVLSGFKHLTLVDMDYIVKSNLNRCIFFNELDAKEKRLKAQVVKEQLLKIDPNLDIQIFTDKIESLPESLIPSHTVVFGCLDNIAARLHVNAHCYYNKIPYIDGATLGMLGKVQVVLPPETPCLECGMNKTHMKVLEKRFSCTGTDITFYEAKLAAEITTTSVVAAVQVREALKIVNLKSDQVFRNIFYYDANRNVSDILEMAINPDCPHHKKDIQMEGELQDTDVIAENQSEVQDDED
ncbi:MAG: ThiF family adenylyltransferase [Thermoplasmata archaeon]